MHHDFDLNKCLFLILAVIINLILIILFESIYLTYLIITERFRRIPMANALCVNFISLVAAYFFR